MTVRALLKGFLIAGIAAIAGGCSSTESTTTDTGGPTGNPFLTILKVNGVYGTPACVAVPDVPDPTLTIEVSTSYTIVSTGTVVNTLELRPPGYCAILQEPQCGHLVALVNGLPNSESSTSVIQVHLGKLANHYGDLEIAIDAVDDLGKPILNGADGGTPSPVTASFKVTTAKSCPSGA